MVGAIIGAVIVGLLAGFIARALLPGRQKMGIVATILLGIAGSLAGYYIFAAIGIGDGDKFDLGGLPGAIIGAMLLLWLYERFAGGSDDTAAPRARGGRRHRAV